MLARFAVDTDVLQLEPAPRPVFALAVSYAYFGRLLVVGTRGLLASAEINRLGDIEPLPDPGHGKKRFYVNGNWGDWPTSGCNGGELSIWRWDGRRAWAEVQGKYDWPRAWEDPRWTRNVRVHGRWLKVYTRGGRVLSECCSCATLKALWKIRLDPDAVRDLGTRLSAPDLDLVDRLIDRVSRRENATHLASPAAIERLEHLLGKEKPLVFVYSFRVTDDQQGTRLDLMADGLPFTFTIARRDGQPPHVTAVDLLPGTNLAPPPGFGDGARDHLPRANHQGLTLPATLRRPACPPMAPASRSFSPPAPDIPAQSGAPHG